MKTILVRALEIYWGMNPYDDGPHRRSAAEMAVKAAGISRGNQAFAVAQVLEAWARRDAEQADLRRKSAAEREAARAAVIVPTEIAGTPGEADYRDAVVAGESGECAAHAAIVRHIEREAAQTPFDGTKQVPSVIYTSHEDFGGMSGGDFDHVLSDTKEWAAAKAAARTALRSQFATVLAYCQPAVDARENARVRAEQAEIDAAYMKRQAEARARWEEFSAEIAAVFPESEGFTVEGERVFLEGEYFFLISDWMKGKLAELKAREMAVRRAELTAEAERGALNKRGAALRAKLGLSDKWTAKEHRGVLQLSAYVRRSRKDGYFVVVDERGRFGKVDRGFTPLGREEAVKLVG